MLKYHIGANGLPARCTASKRACPLGGVENHFATKKECQLAADLRNSEKHGVFSKKSTPIKQVRNWIGTGSPYFKVTHQENGAYFRTLPDGTVVHPVAFLQRILSDEKSDFYGFEALSDELELAETTDKPAKLDKPIDGDPLGFCQDKKVYSYIENGEKRYTTKQVMLYNKICKHPPFTEDILFDIAGGKYTFYRGSTTEPEIIERYLDNEDLCSKPT